MALNPKNDQEWMAAQRAIQATRNGDAYAPLSPSICCLAGVESREDLANALWDALRTQACATGTKAHRIVMLHKHDVENAVRQLWPDNNPGQTPEGRSPGGCL